MTNGDIVSWLIILAFAYWTFRSIRAKAKRQSATLAHHDDQGDAAPDLGTAEGQSFEIEYCNSEGVHSDRRITVWGLKEGTSGIPMLVARCHKSNKTRTFRTDRIECVIDNSGEVHEDVPAFLHDTFGMPLEIARRSG